ncbi:YhdT family protein [Pectinatus brassicae]|uniref:Putative membrane protein YhdT n=1 Tax=Pectinatus brassicae TaxID=862415 RepID=A0A840UMZ7_9FIRM|nr:YhdT family protein [Pectinatus brassicae]MBB5337197.1 putative membrane protein YhdT [Pectinatus brassicae]
MKKLSYKEKFIQMNREARIICIITAIIIIFWWLMAFGINQDITFFSLPVWFIGACIGTYLLTVILIIFAVKKFFVDFDLDDEITKRTDD